MPTRQAAANIYTTGAYLQSSPEWHVGDSPWKAKQILKAFSRAKIAPKSICEVGCGAGEILVQLQNQMPDDVRFAGYEISPQAYELCKPRIRAGLEFHLEDFANEPTPPYDAALAIDVFEHVDDCFGFLRKLKTKATYKVFHIPLDMCVQNVFRVNPIMKLRRDVGHLHYFMKDTALELLTDTGHEIVDWFYTPGHELTQHSLKAELVRLPRKIGYKLAPDFTARTLGGFSVMVVTK
jgi:2-polyprenyl-3-methyl-5-hydroxy-6-metoxy-1,4-benzoquinol methylase